MKSVEYLKEKGYMVEDARGSTTRVANAIKRLSEVTDFEGFKKELNSLINPSTYDSFPREFCLEALKNAQTKIQADEDQLKIVNEIVRLYEEIGIFTGQMKKVVSVY